MEVEEVILHVGLAKTGSTAIQRALEQARPQLLGQQALYPNLDHHHLQSLFANSPHTLVQVARLGLKSREEERAYIDAFREALERAVAEHQPRQIILSSEYIPSMSEAEMARLADYLRGLAPKLRVLAYVRDPWSFTIAIAQQDIRDGLRLPGPFGYHGDLRDYLDRLERGFGQEPEVRLYGSDVVAGFAEWIGHALPADTQRANPSLGLEPACVLAALNEIYPQVVDGVYRQDGLRDWMVEMVCRAFPEAKPIRISWQTAQSIRNQAEADLREVSERYFGGRPVFEDVFAQQTFIDGPDEISLDRLSKADLAKGLFEALRLMSIRAHYHRDRVDAMRERLRVMRILAEWTDTP